jgi:hypothetical protein
LNWSHARAAAMVLNRVDPLTTIRKFDVNQRHEHHIVATAEVIERP